MMETGKLYAGQAVVGRVSSEGGKSWSGRAVEGRDQCPECQRYLQLGEGSLCIAPGGSFTEASEIVGWASGRCERFEKFESLF